MKHKILIFIYIGCTFIIPNAIIFIQVKMKDKHVYLKYFQSSLLTKFECACNRPKFIIDIIFPCMDHNNFPTISYYNVNFHEFLCSHYILYITSLYCTVNLTRFKLSLTLFKLTCT